MHGYFGTSDGILHSWRYFINEEIDPDIQSLGLSDQEKYFLVTFFQSINNPRAADESKLFDYPQLLVPHECLGDENSVKDENNGVIVGDTLIEIPVSGKDGRKKQEFYRCNRS